LKILHEVSATATKGYPYANDTAIIGDTHIGRTIGVSSGGDGIAQMVDAILGGKYEGRPPGFCSNGGLEGATDCSDHCNCSANTPLILL
jgi:hypothetical protein